MKPSRRKRTKVETCRSSVRMLCRCLLTLGFIMQSWQFLSLYLQYPSTVELEVMQPSEFEMPAITICNINEIKSTPYCRKYSESCGNPQSDPLFCTHFPEYCSRVNITENVPNQDISNFIKLSRGEQQLLGHQYEDLVTKCTIETNDEKYNCKGKPLLVPAKSPLHKVPFNCFMMNSLHKKPGIRPTRMPVSTIINIQLNMEVSEYHPSHGSRGALLIVHSPYHIPSPSREGFFLNMGVFYRIHVTMVEKLLLRYPFKSNCMDYDEQWHKNGGKGPVTEEMCKEMCKLNISLDQYDCAERNIDYPHNETICSEAIPYFAMKNNERCGRKCSPPCKINKYKLEVQQATTEWKKENCKKATDLSCATLVYLIFDNFEITTLTYHPRFEGFYSYIGGYVGLWLGISLLSIYDFLETRLFRFLTALKLWWRRRHREIEIHENTYNSRTKEKRRQSILHRRTR